MERGVLHAVRYFMPGAPHGWRSRVLLDAASSMGRISAARNPLPALLRSPAQLVSAVAYFSRTMTDTTARQELDSTVTAYRRTADVGVLLGKLEQIAHAHSTADLIVALEPHQQLQEVIGPVYEVIIEREPDNARALIALAQAYWLTGRGPDVVSGLAERARAADPSYLAAWHMWALAESAPRERTERWRQVVERFPDDPMSRVNLADSAASLAGAEDDPVALKLAVANYEHLLARATREEERAALNHALKSLRSLLR